MLATSGLSAYSRSAEFEADEIGTYILNRAGYDPYAMVSFFEKLVAMEEQAGGGGGGLFASHPPTRERIERVRKLADSFGRQRSHQKNIVGNFSRLKNQIQALH
jgi:predicted Zn-dependent protease